MSSNFLFQFSYNFEAAGRPPKKVETSHRGVSLWGQCGIRQAKFPTRFALRNPPKDQRFAARKIIPRRELPCVIPPREQNGRE